MERVKHYLSTVCYLKENDKILMLKFYKKYGQVYTPPGGKLESGETPLDCILREFKEETGLTLINPKLQGMSYWKDSTEGIIFVYVCEQYEGQLCENENEGKLEWIPAEKLLDIYQFDQNKKFTPYLFQNDFFEGKFLLDDSCNVLEYKIRKN